MVQFNVTVKTFLSKKFLFSKKLRDSTVHVTSIFYPPQTIVSQDSASVTRVSSGPIWISGDRVARDFHAGLTT